MSRRGNPKKSTKVSSSVYLLDTADRVIIEAMVLLCEKLRQVYVLNDTERGYLQAAMIVFCGMPKFRLPIPGHLLYISAVWTVDAGPGRLGALIVFSEEGIRLSYGIPTESYRDIRIIFDWNAKVGSAPQRTDNILALAGRDRIQPFHQAVRQLAPGDVRLISTPLLTLPGGIELPSEDEDSGDYQRPATAADHLLAQADEEEGIQLDIIRIPVPVRCDICGCDFIKEKLLVDGRLGNSITFADMCIRCAVLYGSGIGYGDGQLYKRQDDGNWLCIAGFRPEEGSGKQL